MRIFISSDMEGTAGIVHWWETEKEHPDQYKDFAEQMSREVGAACQGVLDGGAEEVVVKDAHDSARNIDFRFLPEQVKLLRGWAGDMHSMMSGIQYGKWDGAIMTGYHSAVGQPGNPLSHTMNLQNYKVRLNGKPASEFLLNAYMASYYGVPVIMITGDQGICDMAKSYIPEITTVPVKQGMGGAVLSIHPALAVKEIQKAARQALSGDLSRCLLPLPEHFKVEIGLRKHSDASSRANYPGARLENADTVVFESDDYLEVMRFLHFCL